VGEGKKKKRREGEWLRKMELVKGKMD